MDNEVIGGGILLAAILAFWNFDLNPFESGKTFNLQEYSCIDDSKEKCEWKNFKQLTYYVSEEEGIPVVKYWDSRNGNFFQAMSGCVIVDEENWSCSGIDIKGLKDGDPIDLGNFHKGWGDKRKVRLVGHINWWLKS